MNEKIKSLVQALISKSDNRKVVWNKTNTANEFKIILSNNSAVTVDSWLDENLQEITCDLAIYNADGNQIVRYAYTSADYTEFQLLKQLHGAASEAYYKIDETLDDMLKEIDHNDIVGDGAKPSEDDLTF